MSSIFKAPRLITFVALQTASDDTATEGHTKYDGSKGRDHDHIDKLLRLLLNLMLCIRDVFAITSDLLLK